MRGKFYSTILLAACQATSASGEVPVCGATRVIDGVTVTVALQSNIHSIGLNFPIGRDGNSRSAGVRRNAAIDITYDLPFAASTARVSHYSVVGVSGANGRRLPYVRELALDCGSDVTLTAATAQNGDVFNAPFPRSPVMSRCIDTLRMNGSYRILARREGEGSFSLIAAGRIDLAAMMDLAERTWRREQARNVRGECRILPLLPPH